MGRAKSKGMDERLRLLGIVSVMVLLVIVAGCSVVGFGRNENPNAANPYARYYTGTKGIEAHFKNLPSTVYYYGADSKADNVFNFGVDIHNEGASFSRGAVFLSGYNPDLIYIDWEGGGFHPGKGTTPCGISIGSIGFGQLGGILRCDGVEVSGGNGITNIKIDSMATLVNGIAQRFDKTTWWNTDKFSDTSIQFTQNPAGSAFTVNYGTSQLEYLQHGRLFIAVLAGIDFRKNGGREFLLAGDTYEFPGGEPAFYEYSAHIVDWSPGLDFSTQKLLLTSCYQYTTYADPVICVDPDPISDNRKVCRPKSRTWSGGNGGPVAVTSVEQENTPRKILFRINVKNVGTGTVYDPGSLEKCSPWSEKRATPNDLNIVYLGDVRVGNSGLRTRGGGGVITCYPEIIRLDPKSRSGSTTCTYPIEYVSAKSAYETPLIVELWYGYSQTEQRNINIKRVI